MKTILLKVEIEDDAKIQAAISYETMGETIKHTSIEFTEITPPTNEELEMRVFGLSKMSKAIYRSGAMWMLKRLGL